MKTYLQRIDELSPEDFGLDQLEYNILLTAQQNDVEVEVGEEVCDNYFDITIGNITFFAISYYHLVVGEPS